MTPLVMFTCLTTAVVVEHAKIVWKGLYLATYLAILPFSVKHTNKSTLLSRAMLHAVVAKVSNGLHCLAFLMESCLTSLYTYS